MGKKEILKVIIPRLRDFYEKMYYKKLEDDFTEDTIIGHFLDPLDLVHPIGDFEKTFNIELFDKLEKIDEEYYTKKFTIGELADLILHNGGKQGTITMVN